MSTAFVGTKWIVEVYGFDSPVPSKGSMSSAAPRVSILSSVAPSGILNKIPGLPKNAVAVSGITSINYSRSKDSPDGSCSIFFAGPLPPNIYIGAWVVVSTVNEDTALIRFVGQIASVDCDYSVDATGCLFQQSQILVREWSSFLKMAVRFDPFSLQHEAGAVATLQNALLGALGVSNKNEEIYNKAIKLIQESFNAYEFAHVLLFLIGSINSKNCVGKAASFNNEDNTLPDVATTLPDLPTEIIDRLRAGKGKLQAAFDIISGDTDLLGSVLPTTPRNPFIGGFMEVLTGVQLAPLYNGGTWDGIFSGGVQEYKSLLKKGYKAVQSFRPSSPGITTLAQVGGPVWDLLQTYCDNSVNEVFTDIWYEPGEDGKTIVGRPVIVVRDKPFALANIASLAGNPKLSKLTGKWSTYDYLPRVFIDNKYIQRFRINNNLYNSPNYIRVNYSGLSESYKVPAGLSIAGGITRLDGEMARFGGNEVSMNINFFGPPSGSLFGFGSGGAFLKDWFEQVKLVAEAWHSYNYRMGNGVIVLKDNNLPIAVGLNVEFQIGNLLLVGHVESINSSFSISPEGIHTTITTVTLSRIVVDKLGSGLGTVGAAAPIPSLAFIDQTEFGRLTVAEKPGGSLPISDLPMPISIDFGLA